MPANDRHGSARLFRDEAEASTVDRLYVRLLRTRRRRQRRRRAAAVGATALGLAFAITLGASETWRGRPLARPSLTLADGHPLLEGKVILTGEEGQAHPLDLSDGSRISLSPNTSLVLERLGPGFIALRLSTGAAELWVEPGGPRQWRVYSPHLTATVLGTRFRLASSASGGRLTVYEGKVLAESPHWSATRIVEAGQIVEVSSPKGGAGATSSADPGRRAAPGDLKRRAAPVDLERRAAPVDLERRAAPVDLERRAAPVDPRAPPAPTEPAQRRRRSPPQRTAGGLSAAPPEAEKPPSHPPAALSKEPAPADARRPAALLAEADEHMARGDLLKAEAAYVELLNREKEAPEAPYAAFSLGLLRMDELNDRLGAQRALEGALRDGRLPAALRNVARKRLQTLTETDGGAP